MRAHFPREIIVNLNKQRELTREQIEEGAGMSTRPPVVQGVSIPPELQRSLPREVTLTGQGKALVVIAILLIVGSMVLGVALSVTRKNQVARYASERADATSTR